MTSIITRHPRAQQYVDKIVTTSPTDLISYRMLAESTGTAALDKYGIAGTYSNVTLSATGIGDGLTAASFDGTTSSCNIYSATFNGVWNGAENTVAFWIKGATAGVWSDSVNRQPFRLFVDGNNYLRFIKGGDNIMNTTYVAGGSANVVAAGTPIADANWHHIAFTTSKVANERKLYVDGVQSGSTTTVDGVWAGSLNSTECAIGAANITPVEVWSGPMAHVAIWDIALTAAQVLSISTLP